MLQKNKKNMIKIAIFFLIIILLLIVLILNKDAIKTLGNRINERISASTVETIVNYEVTSKSGDTFKVFFTVENANGIEQIEVSDFTINFNGRKKVALDRVLKENDVLQLKVKIVGQEEELYTYVATEKPTVTVLDSDPLGDGITQTIEIGHPDNEKVTTYYSLDNKKTWQVYSESINVLKGDNLWAKIEYAEGITINKPYSTPKSERYGIGVNYTAPVSENIRWKLFYENTEGDSFIIASDYLNVAETAVKNMVTATGMSIEGNYVVYWLGPAKIPTKYVGAETINSNEYKEKFITNWENSWIAKYNTKTTITTRCMATFLDTEAWTALANGQSGEQQVLGTQAIATPTLEMWSASWNDVYPTSKLILSTSNSVGYVQEDIGPNTGNSGFAIIGKNNKLYFPNTSTSGCSGYWLASPAAAGNDRIQRIISSSSASGYFTHSIYAIRPVIYIPNTYELKMNVETGMYDIVEK